MIADAERIRSALSYIPPHNRDDWVEAAMAVKYALGEDGLSLFDEWSQGADSYNEKDARAVWKSCKNGIGKPVTERTLFYKARSYGWEDTTGKKEPTAAEIAERKRRDAERQAQDQAQIERERAQGGKKAFALWNAATPATAENPYLSRKGVTPPETLRELDASEAGRILGYTPKSSGEALNGRLLVVPVKRDDTLSTVELIDGDGRKTALAGRGTKAGGYWATGDLQDARTILIGEGVATVLSASQAMACPGIAALSSGNLTSVSKVIQKRNPNAELVILADLVKKTGEPDPHAVEAAQTVGGLLALPDFGPDRPEQLTDFNDLQAHRGAEAVKAAVGASQAPAQDDAQAIGRLAALSPLEYDRCRKDEAQRLGVQVSTLDQMVRTARKEDAAEALGDFEDIDPWPDPVDGGALLSDIEATILRFIVCEPETARAAALWAAMTWLMDVVQVAPLAVITAPEKRCGKTQLLSLLGRLVYRPLTASNISPAAMFRSIDAWRPTLLVDEADAFMRENEELRGVLNAGHTREGAYVVRVVGDDHQPKKFSVWGAKAVAGIGNLAPTLMDRAITLRLRRKRPHESVERLRHAEPGLFNELRAKLARFALDWSNDIRRARPDLPDALNDRAQDNWEPLLAIADTAGVQWPQIARAAALSLSRDDDTGSVGVELLADIREAFDQRQANRLPTNELIDSLCEDTEAPWATWNRGNKISARQIGARLKEYGIASKNLKLGYADVKKGYERSQFEDAWTRYLSSPGTPPNLPLPATDRTTQGFDGSGYETGSGYRVQSATQKPSQDAACSGRTDRSGGEPGDITDVEVF